MKTIHLILSVFVFSGILSCNSKYKLSGQPGPPMGGNPDQVEAYSTITLQSINIILYREFPATLQDVEIRQKVDGYIEHTYVREGDRVKRGQLLFTIFNPSYSQNITSIQASMKSAETGVRNTEIDLKNTKELVDRKIVGDFQLKTKQNDLENKRQALKVLQVNVSIQQTNVGYTRITTPGDGIISTIPYKEGSLVSSTNSLPLTTFSNASNIMTYFSVSEEDLLKYNNDLGTDAYLVLANDPVFASRGSVQSASGLINSQTGSATYTATFQNIENVLRSGGFATVKIPYQMPNVIAIPQSATYEI